MKRSPTLAVNGPDLWSGAEDLGGIYLPRPQYLYFGQFIGAFEHV